MRHVEAVIRLFVPGFDVRGIAVRRRNNDKRGIMGRAGLGVLKAAMEPLTTKAIAEVASPRDGG